MTLIVESDEGVAHWPPMKNRSVCSTGTFASLAEMVIGPPITVLEAAGQSGHKGRSLNVTSSLDVRQTGHQSAPDKLAADGLGPSHKPA
jgi:hypothetical protein